MRLSELRGKIVRSLDGEKLGRVHEIHCEAGRVTAVICGAGSIVERWTGKRSGKRIRWEAVRRIDRDAVIVADARSRRRSASRD